MNNLEDLQRRYLLPNGAELAAEVNANIVHNFRREGASSAELLSLWRLAKCVVNEATPLLIYSFPQR